MECYFRQEVNAGVLFLDLFRHISFIDQDIMKTTLLPLLLLLLLLPITTSKLYQVVALLSPGARYHQNDYYDGAETRTLWGQITPVGLRQSENLGKAFKRDYIDTQQLLSNTFKKDEFELLTVSFNRSVLTGLSNLYGMYGLGNGQKLEPAKPVYHIPPYSYNNDLQEPSFALPNGQLIYAAKLNSALLGECPNAEAEVEKNIRQRLDDYNEMQVTYTPLLKRMSTLFASGATLNFTKLAAIVDTLTVDRYLGRPLPSGLTSDDLANADHLNSWFWLFTRSFSLSKAYTTYPFTHVLEAFDNRIKSPSAGGLRWTTLSVDSPHIVSALNLLNISSASCVEEIYRKGSSSALNCQTTAPFASSILFELHSDNAKDFYIKIRSNGAYVNTCEAKQTNCAYSEWKPRVQANLLPNPVSICGSPRVPTASMNVMVE